MKTADPRLVEFILEAKKEGYDEYHIRQPLLEKGWASEEIDNAFFLANKPNIKKSGVKTGSGKTKIDIYLDSEIIKTIERKAKRNLLSVPEQIEDIVRRSVVRSKFFKPLQPEKIDDLLVAIFSRRKSGRKS